MILRRKCLTRYLKTASVNVSRDFPAGIANHSTAHRYVVGLLNFLLPSYTPMHAGTRKKELRVLG